MREHALRIGDRRITLVEGPAGWGEISPVAGYPCAPEAARRAAIEAACDGFPEPVRPAVTVNGFVPDGAEIDIALGTRLAGFRCVKMKVGRGEPADDIARVRALRDLVDPAVAIRIDANGAWDVETAASVLSSISRAGVELEFAEQPVATIGELAELRRIVEVSLAADECVRTLDDARAVRAAGAADVIVLKVQPAGGVRRALALADAAALPAVVSSMLETSIGIAAGLALAAALPGLPYACGLATLDELAGDVVSSPLRPLGDVLTVPDAWPVPSPDLLARYSVAEKRS
ncbi:MAG: enolase C-terminal domain-like protein [Acidimicrobiia bacterium]